MKAHRLILLLAAMFTLLFISVYAADVRAGVVQVDSSINVRSAASASAEKIGSATNGTGVVITGQENNFYKVVFNGKAGYMTCDYVKVVNEIDYNFGPGKVTGSVLNVRSMPNTDAGIEVKLSQGAVVDVVGFYSGWFRVKTGNASGYVSGEYITLEGVSGSASSNSSVAQQICSYAAEFLGVKYKAGGKSPSTGFDCSGYTAYVFKKFGYSLNASSKSQYNQGTAVEKANLIPGDLVFFSKPGSSSIAHVGIYTGDGQFIHSPSPGKVVEYEPMSSSYYTKYYVGARRIV